MTEFYKGARVVDPANGLDDKCDFRVVDGRIVAIGAGLAPEADDTVVDLANLTVIPGLVDSQVHLREPGTRGETIASGTASALRGGVTTVVAMPDTNPAIDDLTSLRSVRALADQTANCKVALMAALTQGRTGEDVTEIPLLAAAGAVAFGDGTSLSSAETFQMACLSAATTDRPIVVLPEDVGLVAGGVVNAGAVALRKGLRGSSSLAESVAIARDALIASASCVSLHISPVTTAAAVEQMQLACGSGRVVTAATTPHHLLYTDADIPGYDNRFKVRPPLRSSEDIDALVEAIREGLITVLASHHAPQPEDRMQLEFQNSPDGPAGVETLLMATLKALVVPGKVSFSQAIALVTCNPARLFGLDAGDLSVGSAADFAVLDTAADTVFSVKESPSLGRNSFFDGQEFPVKIRSVHVDGIRRHES